MDTFRFRGADASTAVCLGAENAAKLFAPTFPGKLKRCDVDGSTADAPLGVHGRGNASKNADEKKLKKFESCKLTVSNKVGLPKSTDTQAARRANFDLALPDTG